MKVIKSGKNNWVAISADGRCLSNGYPQTTPGAARRIGEQVIANAYKINVLDSFSNSWILCSRWNVNI